MITEGAMSPARAKHPFRWALICALLAVAGGAAAERAAYAEVGATASVVRGEAGVGAARQRAARKRAARALAVVAGTHSARVADARIVAHDVADARAGTPLYLEHCALLL
jgi:hypothetical protein